MRICTALFNTGAKLAANPKFPGADVPSSSTVPDVSRGRILWAPLLAIMAAAFAVEVPFFFLGTPSGHDVDFHLYTWLEVLSQWKQGIFYPRWAAMAHFAYGEPRFVFYPPASWSLGASLAAIFPWTLVPSLYVWIVLVAAGASMFLLARQWLDRRDATFAAVLYAVNPYHLVTVYWRSSFAELLASALLPLLLLLVLQDDGKVWRRTLSLALVLAAAWLVNAPAAVMIHYSLALVLLIVVWQKRSVRVLIPAVAAIALGAALAGFYLLPAIYEQRWIDIAQSVSPGARPLDNFLFDRTTDAEHDAFNLLISWMAVGEIVLVLIAAWMARNWRRSNPLLWYSLAVWAAACAVFMCSFTNPAWNILPKMRFMQFPWRWLLCMGVPFSLLTALGLRRWTARAAFYVTSLCLLAFVWHHFQPPWWDTAADLREMQDIMASGAGYEGTDEYTPAGAQPGSIEKDARRVVVIGPAHAAIRVTQWDAERKLFSAQMSAADDLALRLFNYPAWRVEVNGHPVDAGLRDETGQMLVPVEKGANEIQITFIRTWDRKAGVWISGIAVLLTMALWRIYPASPLR